ncbi:hypothetical protein KCU87_g530, partial [Aureobasidium melanogenum]
MIETSMVSGRMAASSSFMSILPSDWTGKYVTSKPSSCKWRQLSRTHLCSVWQVMMWFFLPPRLKKRATPLMLMLLLSVAPDVKMISLGLVCFPTIGVRVVA